MTLYIETDEGIVALDKPPDKPPRITLGLKEEPEPVPRKRRKAEVADDVSDET
jgi:hypothetical protein